MYEISEDAALNETAASSFFPSQLVFSYQYMPKRVY